MSTANDANANANKVAQVTLVFWALKILATTLGETSGDLVAITLGAGYVAGLLLAMAFFAVMLVLQLKASRFHALVFWGVIVGTTILGTEVSDLMDRTLGLGYPAGAAILAAALFATLGVWYWKERGIRIYPISGRREELFYWGAILCSNSLGTAFGDMLSDTFSLGYVNGALITAAIIALVIVVHFATQFNEKILFWVAFVFTRPFGATFGDFLTKPTTNGGLDRSTLTASLVALALMLGILGLGYVRRTATQAQ